MRYKLFFLSVFLVILLVSGSYKLAMIPDPDAFAKNYLELIKKQNKGLYLSTYALTSSDLDWMTNVIVNDQYKSDEIKSEWKERISDTSMLKKVSEEVGKGYDNIESWLKSDSIDVNAIEFVRFYYDLRYSQYAPFQILFDSELYVKHKDNYYCIVIGYAMYVNGKWSVGRVNQVMAVTQFLETDYAKLYGADTTMVTVDSTMDYTEEVPMDTTYPVDIPQYIPLTKKEVRLEKKIDKYYQKIYKLEDELYRDELNQDYTK